MSDQEKGKNKEYVIVVNAERHEIKNKNITFEQVIALAFPTPTSGEAIYTVTYRGADKPKEGSLKPGGSVKVKEQGTVFNVTSTTKS